MLCGEEVFNKGIEGEWIVSMTNICTRTKQVKTILICSGRQMLCVPFLPQKQDTLGSAFTISEDLARNVEQLKNTSDCIIWEIIKPVGEFENYLDL